MTFTQEDVTDFEEHSAQQLCLSSAAVPTGAGQGGKQGSEEHRGYRRRALGEGSLGPRPLCNRSRLFTPPGKETVVY